MTRDGEGFETLPQGAQPCIWMTAGLVAYKLCDRGFACETCPLDRGMRSREAAPTEGPGVPRWCFPDDRRYHPGHVWAAQVGKGRVRTGLDAFAVRLLDHTTSVVLPAPGSRLRGGGAGSWHGSGADLIPMPVPVSGCVVRQNPRLIERPRLAIADAYGAGWLMEAECETPLSRVEGLLSGPEMRERAEHQLEKLRRRVANRLDGPGSVGPTLQDGGQPLHGLRAFLGPRDYRRFIAPFLT